jgi:hypothetical protein
MSSSNNFEMNHRPQRKRRWDAILVGTGMVVAFSIVMMRLTGYFPCDIVDALAITDVTCASWVETHWAAFAEWFGATIYSRIQIS